MVWKSLLNVSLKPWGEAWKGKTQRGQYRLVVDLVLLEVWAYVALTTSHTSSIDFSNP